MKAIRFHEFGDAHILRYEEAPTPTIGPNDVLLQLKAAALNHLDVFARSGAREKNIPLPHIPGSDGSGVIAEVGSTVELVRRGDKVLISPGISCGNCPECLSKRDNLCRSYRVLGTKEDGTYAEYVRLPSANVVPIPEGLTFEEAAAIPLVFLTAWHMLVTLAKVHPGEIVLVHGAGSGVGSAGIQIAKLFGARVITTAGSNDKLVKAKALGADELINYQENDFAEEVKRITGKRGVDIVFEHIGGEVFRKSLTVVAKGGRLVTCGSTTDFNTNIDLRYIYSRHQTIYGSWMGSKNEMFDVMKFFSAEGDVARRRLRPVIDSVFPLAQAANAQLWMEERRNFGKIVLKIS
ncbi:MAG: zinc-binding dehydrogenase [Ignavibacteriae bacterium]|nr:zinc-binding dehydrogenase [Ignavibacteria bacterium]MBI3365049.1 zinc-binding dehydrogenase [Ignavibacteriota bacterium]